VQVSDFIYLHAMTAASQVCNICCYISSFLFLRILKIDCAAPVPSSGLVLIITAYNTVFNSTGTPAGFEFIVAIDWFTDRLITALNVTGDCVVCAVVASVTPLEEFEEAAKHIAADGDKDDELEA
jgi:Na+/H+-dicarboxylate symporter